jgi:uncharacterized membrane protein
MATLSQAKTLGGVGWILTILSFAPFYSGTVLNIVGLIMILIAIKYISDVTADRKIYTNTMIGVIIAVIGAITFAATIGYAIYSFAGLGSFFGAMRFGNPPPVANLPPGDLFSLIAVLAAGLLTV